MAIKLLSAGRSALVFFAMLSGSQLVQANGVPAWDVFYQSRYPLADAYTKLISNTGQGPAILYGTRNFRSVLNGVVYRGGANNVYFKPPRANQNPLTNTGLQNLCEEGFSNAVYLYSTNYNTAPHHLNCQNIRGGQNSFEYKQYSPMASDGLKKIVNLVAQTLAGNTTGPLYLHCWNGWHASGLASAVILRQFCGFTADQAVNYWNKNTDGVNGPSYESVRAKVRAYQVDGNLIPSPSIQRQICPNP